MKLSKNMKSALGKYDRDVEYSISDAVKIVQDLKYSSFDESVDVALILM